jgi:hypothetical protein
MKTICIRPAAQLGIGAVLAAGVAAAVIAEEPELRRYLKIKSM